LGPTIISTFGTYVPILFPWSPARRRVPTPRRAMSPTAHYVPH